MAYGGPTGPAGGWPMPSSAGFHPSRAPPFPPPHSGFVPPPPHMFQHGSVPSHHPMPPADPQLLQSIEKVAEFVVARAQDGLSFEQTLREKEKTNPKFAFLFPGAPFNDFYQWKMAQLRQRAPGAASTAVDKDTPLSLPAEIVSNIQNMLKNLSGSQQSIIDTRVMLMDNYPSHEAAIATLLKRQIIQEPASSKKLFLLYLISDIFHAGMKRRTAEADLDPLSSALLTDLPPMLRSLGTVDPDTRAKAEKVLQIWESRSIFDQTTINRLRSEIQPPLGLTAAPPPPPPMLHPFIPPPFGMPPIPGILPPPPHTGMMMQHPSFPPPPMMPGMLPMHPAPPMPPPTGFPAHLDPNTCLPPGLLVSHTRLTRPDPYTPINPSTINMVAASGPVDLDTHNKLSALIDSFLTHLPTDPAT